MASRETRQRGRLLLETLEQRQLMAGDMELLSTNGSNVASSPESTGLQVSGQAQAQGEPAPDLVQFAKDLAAKEVNGQKVVFYGAHWCPACTAQKELFADGKNDLPFVEVTNPDRSINSIGEVNDITEFPTWVFPDGTRLVGVQTLATLSERAGVPIPQSEQPTFEPIGNLTVFTGSPLHVPVDAYDPDGGPLTVTVSVENSSLLQATVLSGNRSIRIDMDGYGDMVFELFDDRAPRAAGRVADLAEDGFYDGIIFHRVVDDFVIQAGDPTGTGTSGSSLGNFDDDFHPDLQHNTEGVLSFAKTSDDTNNSQFFVTEVETRFLDFNHSIFGQMVEGFDVLEAISQTQVNNSTENKPVRDVTITTIDVFDDTENSVVMLKPVGNATGTTNVTFTVRDQDGNTHTETIAVTVAADASNSQPFLNPITTPAATTRNTAAQLQLSSIDVEGDAVSYFASTTATTNATVNVNSTTGLVTVTPATDFTGTVNVQVGVRPGVGVTGNAASDSDNQTVAFTFQGENVVATPTSVDLQTGSDTGSSDIDNITNAGSLTFLVSGVTGGATVELVNSATGSVVGTAIAASGATTTTVTTDNIAALGTGTYQIAARQRVGSSTSSPSPVLSLTYDNTQPASVIANASTQANVDRAFTTDLISSEEGSGLRYAFASAPTGATINASTGVIQWTPTSAQLGANEFQLTLTDAAGNVRTETLTVNVAGEPLAEIKLEATDLNGNPISSLDVGDVFLLNLYGVDARPFVQRGVYAAYADVLYDSALLRPDPGSSITYANDFTLISKGAFRNGLIDELGAVNTNLAASNRKESLIATVRMEAIASGTVNIRSEPADDSNSEVLIFGENDRIPANEVAYGNVSLAIGQNFTVGDDNFTVAEDSGATSLNVLANDEILTGGGELSVVSVTQPTGGTVTLNGGTVRFTPTANFNGDAVFTYRVSDAGGTQDNGTVTVTVASVNDRPVGGDDTPTVDQNSTNNTLDVLSNDTFAPDTGETLSIIAVSATNNGGSVSVASDGRSLQYTPASGFVGTETFSYSLSDGSLTDEVDVTVTVVSVDDPPTAVADAFNVTEDAAEASFNVTINDTRDADNQSFVLASVGTPSAGGSARISSDGTQFFYQPAANFAGTETVTYTIRDTGGGSAVGTVTFSVAGVNDPPPVASPTVKVNRSSGETVVLRLEDLPANVDAGETLTFTNVTSPTTASGTVRIDTANDTILYTPPSTSFTGSDSFVYTINDGTSSETGTVTVEVSEFTQRDIFVDYVWQDRFSLSGLMLKGTDLLGQTVEVAATNGGNGLLFDNVLPGDYVIEVPAMPFLQNGVSAKQIPVVSAASDGNTTVQLDVGRLRPEYISIRDWLGSASKDSLLVAASPGQSNITPLDASSSVITNPVVSLDDAGENLTIAGTREVDSEAQNFQAVLATTQDPRVQTRGVVNDFGLYRVNVANGDFTESGVAAGVIVADAAVDSASTDLNSNALTVGDVAAQGESIASTSVSRTDVIVPALADGSTRTDATVLALEDGDVWVGDSLAEEQGTKLVDAASVDAAMQNVTDELSLVSTTGEKLAEESSVDAHSVDQALTREL